MSRAKRLTASILVAALLALPGVSFAESAPVEPLPRPMPTVESPKGEASPEAIAPKVTRVEAITFARAVFAIPAEMGQPNVNLQQSRGQSSWHLNWETPPRKNPDRQSISVTVDALSGAILGYNTWSETDSNSPLTYTRTEAAKLAQEWLGRLVADLPADQIRLVDSPLDYGWYGGGNATYEFRWERLVAGYPVENDGINISIDSRTGKLLSYHRSWRSATTFTLPQEILAKADAEAAFRQFPMLVQYQRYQKPFTEEAEWRVVYRPMNGYPMANHEGTLIDRNGQPINLTYLGQMALVPPSDKPYQAPAEPLTEQEALALARAATGQEGVPTYSMYSEWGEEQQQKVWEFSWESAEPKTGFSTNVRVDAQRGVVLSYNSWGPYDRTKEEQEPLFTEEQAHAIAVDFMRQHRPDLSGSLMLMPTDENLIQKYKMAGINPTSYSVRFQRLHDGIVIAEQGSSLEVDAITGQVRSFWGNDNQSSTEPFPAADGLITSQEAMATVLEQMGLELTWVTLWNQEAQLTKEPNVESEPVLVWSLGRTLSIAAVDAKTGIPYDGEGRDLIEALKRPVDIDGHFAQREIELLWSRRILELNDGKFSPDMTVTAGEVTRWLVLSRGLRPYASYDFSAAFAGKGAAGLMVADRLANHADNAYIGAGFQAGFLLPEDFEGSADPSASVSRELFALWAARAMGYASIAKMPNRIAMPFADKEQISARYENAVALLHGLGVISGGPDANFYPQRMLTRGEAAKILFAVTSEVRR